MKHGFMDLMSKLRLIRSTGLEAFWIAKTEKVQQIQSNVKVLLIAFFDYDGVGRYADFLRNLS